MLPTCSVICPVSEIAVVATRNPDKMRFTAPGSVEPFASWPSHPPQAQDPFRSMSSLGSEAVASSPAEEHIYSPQFRTPTSECPGASIDERMEELRSYDPVSSESLYTKLRGAHTPSRERPLTPVFRHHQDSGQRLPPIVDVPPAYSSESP